VKYEVMKIMDRFFLFLHVVSRPVDTFVPVISHIFSIYSEKIINKDSVFLPSGTLQLLSHLEVQSVFLQCAYSEIPQRWKSQSAKSELNGG
jgi:hypothetical protein